MPQYTDNPVSTSIHVRIIHINELRNYIDGYLEAVGHAGWSWSDGNPISTTTHIRSQHFTEIQAAIQWLWTNGAHGDLGTIPQWSYGSTPSEGRHVSARDMNDLRNWLNYYAGDPLSIYYGSDTGTGPTSACGINFYIGRVGQGTTGDQTLSPPYPFFNTSAADRAGWANTYCYWAIFGPSPLSTDAAAYAYGQQQAAQVPAAIASAPRVIGRATVWADIEAAGGGWYTDSSDLHLNQQVWLGFYDWILSNSGGLLCGLYTNSSDWGSFMGSSFAAPDGTPIWSSDNHNTYTGCDGAEGFECPGAGDFNNLPTLAGMRPILWQYNTSCIGTGCCPQDYDAATFLPA